MDIFLPIVICVILFIVFSVCGWCCKRNRQGTVYRDGPVTVTTASTYGVTNPPYPVDQPMGQPQPGFNIGGPMPPYPTVGPQHPMPGYPTQVPLGHHPMPMPMGYTSAAPYPPITTPYPPAVPPYPSQAAQLPPSYAEAVTQPPTTEIYAKQSPYNPNYQ